MRAVITTFLVGCGAARAPASAPPCVPTTPDQWAMPCGPWSPSDATWAQIADSFVGLTDLSGSLVPRSPREWALSPIPMTYSLSLEEQYGEVRAYDLRDGVHTTAIGRTHVLLTACPRELYSEAFGTLRVELQVVDDDGTPIRLEVAADVQIRLNQNDPQDLVLFGSGEGDSAALAALVLRHVITQPDGLSTPGCGHVFVNFGGPLSWGPDVVVRCGKSYHLIIEKSPSP